MHAIETVTDRMTLVMLDIRLWSGRKKLRPEDLHLSDGEIPPDDLVSLGSKRVFDPEPLKVFSRLKQNAERVCLNVGTRFLGGFAVPNTEAAAVASHLHGLKGQFDSESGDFLGNYDRALEQWIVALPAWEAPIRRAVEPVEAVGDKLHFGFQLIAVRPAEHAGTLAEEVQGLGNGIFAEVGRMARELDASFEGKNKLHRRALGTFARIREKLACLSFVDTRIDPVVDTVDDWVGRLPLAGPIAGGLFIEGMGLALLLSDPERMARHGAGRMDLRHGRVPAEADDDPASTPPDAPAEGVAPPSAVPVPPPEPVARSFFF